MKFIKDSIRELKHVVWPTREESNKYFIAVVSILVMFGLYLFVFSSIFSKGLFAIKNFVSPSEINIIEPNSIEVVPSTGTLSTGNVEKVTSTSSTSTGNISN